MTNLSLSFKRKDRVVFFVITVGIVFYSVSLVVLSLPPPLPTEAQLLQPGTSEQLQQVPQTTTTKPITPQQQQKPRPNIHGVMITSPTDGQRIPVGKNVTVSGTSVDNAASDNCHISVSVNRIRPYQAAKGIGPGGASDYSKWNFVLTSKYTTIKEGTNNRITARYDCNIDNPAILSFNSVNVTGVVVAAAAAATTTHANTIPSNKL
jgi:hypothetical protein